MKGARLGQLRAKLNQAAAMHLAPICQKRGMDVPAFEVAAAVGTNLLRRLYKLTW